MKKITLLLLLLTLSALGQEKYTIKADLPEMTVGDLLKHTDTLFKPESNFSYNCTTNYLLPYKNILLDISAQPDYVEEQLALIKKDSLQPYPYSNLGLYYENKGEAVLSQKYYNSALDKVKNLSVEKDSARYYSYKSYIKYHVGQDGAAEMEKALSINKTDSLAVVFYPMYLLGTQKYDEAKRILSGTLDNEKFKYGAYLMLFMAETFSEIAKMSDTKGDASDAYAKIDLKTFVDMRPYQKYFKKNDDYFELMREMADMFVVTMKMMGTLSDRDYKPAAADLALVEAKEKFFKSHLKKKDANLFGLYMSLGASSLARRDFKASVDYYQKAIDDFPKDKESVLFSRLDAYYNIATIHHYLKEYDKSIAVVKQVVAIETLTPANKSAALLALGKLYFEQNNLDAATDYGSQAVAVQETFDATLFMAYMYLRQGLGTLSNRYAEKAQRLSSTLDNLSDIVNYFMIMKIADGHPDDAVAVFNDNKESLAGTCQTCEYIIAHYLEEKK